MHSNRSQESNVPQTPGKTWQDDPRLNKQPDIIFGHLCSPSTAVKPEQDSTDCSGSQ